MNYKILKTGILSCLLGSTYGLNAMADLSFIKKPFNNLNLISGISLPALSQQLPTFSSFTGNLNNFYQQYPTQVKIGAAVAGGSVASSLLYYAWKNRAKSLATVPGAYVEPENQVPVTSKPDVAQANSLITKPSFSLLPLPQLSEPHKSFMSPTVGVLYFMKNTPWPIKNALGLWKDRLFVKKIAEQDPVSKQSQSSSSSSSSSSVATAPNGGLSESAAIKAAIELSKGKGKKPKEEPENPAVYLTDSAMLNVHAKQLEEAAKSNGKGMADSEILIAELAKIAQRSEKPLNESSDSSDGSTGSDSSAASSSADSSGSASPVIGSRSPSSNTELVPQFLPINSGASIAESGGFVLIDNAQSNASVLASSEFTPLALSKLKPLVNDEAKIDEYLQRELGQFEDYRERIQRGSKRLHDLLYVKPFSIHDPVMMLREEYLEEIIDVLWSMFAYAIEKGEGFKEGTILIKDPQNSIYQYLLRYVQMANPEKWMNVAGINGSKNPFAYSRKTTHFNNSKAYGIDMRHKEHEHAQSRLPGFMKHFFFMKLNNGYLALRMEEHGLTRGEDLFWHGWGTVLSFGRKYCPRIFGSNDGAQCRKERIPADFINELKLLISAEEKKFNGQSDLQSIQTISDFWKRFDNVREENWALLIKKLDSQYDNLSDRFGREVILTPQDLYSLEYYNLLEQDSYSANALKDIATVVTAAKQLLREFKQQRNIYGSPNPVWIKNELIQSYKQWPNDQDEQKLLAAAPNIKEIVLDYKRDIQILISLDKAPRAEALCKFFNPEFKRLNIYCANDPFNNNAASIIPANKITSGITIAATSANSSFSSSSYTTPTHDERYGRVRLHMKNPLEAQKAERKERALERMRLKEEAQKLLQEKSNKDEATVEQSDRMYHSFEQETKAILARYGYDKASLNKDPIENLPEALNNKIIILVNNVYLPHDVLALWAELSKPIKATKLSVELRDRVQAVHVQVLAQVYHGFVAKALETGAFGDFKSCQKELLEAWSKLS